MLVDFRFMFSESMATAGDGRRVCVNSVPGHWSGTSTIKGIRDQRVMDTACVTLVLFVDRTLYMTVLCRVVVK